MNSSEFDPEIRGSLKHNLIYNLIDGGFFGMAIGFASFVTVLPLFVSNMTDSPILIGLIPAIHSMGWQLPQLLIADRVARLSRYKPMVLWLTIQERLPFLGLAAVAWFLPRIGNKIGLVVTFTLLIWQGLGGGVTATAWQSMIAKIIPPDRRGTFYGAQSAAANLLASISAILAGYLLENLPNPQNYVACFLLACVSMTISWFALAQTREPERIPSNIPPNRSAFWQGLGSILRRDMNFRWFLAVRMLSQFAIMAFAFYTVYAVRTLGMSEISVGLMTGVYLGTQIAVNPLMGWLGDHWGHRTLLEAGALAAAASALLAWWAPSPDWFYLVFILAGIATVSVWTISLAMILEFGEEADRPAYIGLANSLIAPATILAPFVGGWLAELAGYPAAFFASSIGGLGTALILHLLVRDPKRSKSNLVYNHQ